MALHQLNWFCLLLIISLFSSNTSGCDEKKMAFTNSNFEYKTPGFYWNDEGYEDNLECNVQFKAYYERDVVEIKINEADLSGCDDRATFYDGSSTLDPVLATICDSDTITFESTGRVILMVFKTDEYSERKKGISLSYDSLDRGGFGDATKPELEFIIPVVVGATVAFVIVIVGIVIWVRYRKKAAERQVAAYSQDQNGAALNSQQNFDLAMRNLQATQQPQPSLPPGQGGLPHYQYPAAQVSLPPQTGSFQPFVPSYPYPSPGYSSQAVVSNPEGNSGVAPPIAPPSYDDVVTESKS